jgi:predicted nucleotidyltransferase
MKTIGIIAEFNPFHLGHRHLLDEAKRLTGADYTVVVMSGDFVQRGAPALLDKYARARMALQNGADLVVELPVAYATGSAEYFARGAVRLLDKLGVVDCLCFGSECGDLGWLKEAAASLAEESPAYRAALQKSLKKGHSFPTARAHAVDSLGQSPIAPIVPANAQVAVDQISQSLSPNPFALPNNILAIEYLRALAHFHSGIVPLTIPRRGNGYHDENIAADGFSSATALRQILLDARASSALPEPFTTQVPGNTLPVYAEQLPALLAEDDFSALLHYKLLTEAGQGFARYQDVTADLSNKIAKNLPRYESYTSFIQLLKSKDLTYTRLSRCLCHILLDICRADVAGYIARDYVSYARVLGFRADAAPLLRQIKKRAALPLLTKLANARRVLDEDGLEMLDKDIQAAHVYNVLAKPPYNEYTAGIVKI